ncbi:MAG: EAL domain-containing protein [Selenomonadaceae bacterium]|nr:EAL domain-containing protein [Selenomonadaceae bacterium]
MANILKKILSVALMLTLTFCADCNAEQSENQTAMSTADMQRQSTDYEKILQNNVDTLKVGYVKGTAFIYEDLPNHKTGYGYEYMEFLSNYANCKFKYVEFDDWGVLASKLQSGEVDVIPSMPGDYKKLSNVTRTEHVVGRYPMELIARAIKPNMRLGVMPIMPDTPSLPSVAAANGFTYETVPYTDYKTMIRDFHQSKIDGYVDSMLDPHDSHDVVDVFDRQSYRLLVRSDNQELLKRLNLAMDQMLMYQSNIRDRLTATYLRSNGFPLMLSREEKDYLAQKKKLRAGIFLAHQPYAYYDEDWNLVGVLPELIKKMSDDLNIEIEIVEGKNLQDIKDMITRGELDFVADSVCDYSWAEQFNISPTKPYLNVEYVPVTRRNYEINPDIPMKVAFDKNLYHAEHFIKLHYPEEQCMPLDNIEDALKAVNSGKADVVYLRRNTAHPMIEATETYMLEPKTASAYSELRSLGVYSHSDPHLWLILNKEIGHIDPTWISDLVNRNQQITTQFSLKSAVYHHPLRSLTVLALIAAAIGGFFIYRGRMRQRHFELVEHVAYTDLRYDLKNVTWIEKEVPPAMDKLRETEPNMKTFFVVFSIASSASATKTQGHRLIDKKFKSMAEEISKEDHVLLIGAGIDVDHLICFCKAETLEEIITWAKSIIANNSYMETFAEGAKIVLHTRAGVTPYTPDLYVQQAVDMAVIACHQNVTDDVQVFDEHLQETLKTNQDIEGRMEQALIDGEFKAWYQPKYNIKTREIIGAEALVRWISPEMGFMPPGKFIPLFERNGFVLQIDYYLLEQTCKLQRERLDAGLEVVPISVNQSRLHMTEEGYLEKIKMIVDTYELPAGLVELEVTETMFGDFDKKSGHDNAEHIINALHELGFSVSVDDFGSGYSSFMMIGSLPMDVMKIDRSLLTGADTSPRLREILRNVINLGNSLKMKVLCEGIETKEEEDLLLELGCYYGQGYLNAKPMPVNDFVAFLEKRNAEIRAQANA